MLGIVALGELTKAMLQAPYPFTLARIHLLYIPTKTEQSEDKESREGITATETAEGTVEFFSGLYA